MPVLDVVTHVEGSPSEALAVSLDLGVELESGRRHRIRALDRGPGSRTEGSIAEGQQVTWAGRLYGVVPFRHTSVIDRVVADDGCGGAFFTDSMRSGLFASFRHEHRFEPLVAASVPGSEAGARTRMTDHVVWQSPLGPLGRVADAAFVRRALVALVADRNAVVAGRLRR